MNRRRKIFERVVNPLLMKYLSYFKEVSATGNGHKLRYRYRGVSKDNYNRPQSFCHMNGADTFSVYPR